MGILKTFFLLKKKEEMEAPPTLNATTEPSATTAAPPPSSLPPPSQPPVVEKEDRKIDPLKSIKDQIVAYDPIAGEEEEEQEQQQKQILTCGVLTKKQESEALPTLKNGEKYTCYTCQTQDSYKWFKSKMEETLGKVVCKRCYHKELVEMSDKICAVRLGPFSSTLREEFFYLNSPKTKFD